jgi:ABC-type uncharacterized transport system auxiliary subunit
MRRIEQAILVVVLAGITAGCGATRPVKYYVLDMGSAPAVAPSAPLPISLLVARLTTAHLYRDDRIVYGAGSVQLGTYEYERWAEPPVGMIQDLLITSLRSTGQYRSVSHIGSNFRGNYIIRGRLIAFYEVDKPELAGRFSIQISLFDSKAGMDVWSDSYSHDEPAHGKTMLDVVEALDRNVRAGLQQLATNLGQYFASHPPQTATAQQ